MQAYSLIRTGKPNIEFTGVIIAEAKSPAFRRHEMYQSKQPAVAEDSNIDTKPKKSKHRAHWFESTVYRTSGGKYVVQIAYRWAGNLNREINQDYVYVVESLDDILKVYSDFAPTECVTGFPDGEYWAPKQAKLMDDIDHDFDLLQELIQNQIVRQQEPERID